MSKRKKIFICFFTFVISFFAIYYFLDIIGLIKISEKEIIENENIKNIDNLRTTLSAILSAIFTFVIKNILEIYKAYKNTLREKESNIPYLSITCIDMTCLRKSENKKYKPEIILGEGNVFVYVFCKLHNAGELDLDKCIINKQELEIEQIKKGDCIYFYFRVCKNCNDDFNKFYFLDMIIIDVREHRYKKNMKLYIDEKEKKAKIESIKKTKRKRGSK